MDLIYWIYTVSGAIFWILSAIMFWIAFRTKLKNDIFFGFYFLGIGWLFPFLGVSTLPGCNSFLPFALISSNILIPIVLTAINLFDDFTVNDRVQWFTLICAFLGGIAIALYVIPQEIHKYEISTLYGQFIYLELELPTLLFARYITMGIALLTTIRFFYTGLKMSSKKPQSAYALWTRRMFFFMFCGMMMWMILSTLKIFFRYALTGIDYLAFAFFFAIVLTFYIRRRESFYFFPNALEYAILISKNGLHILDYDFKTNQIDLHENNEKPSPNFTTSRLLLFGATQALKFTLEQERNEHEIQQIQFSSTRIYCYTSKNILWFLLSSRDFSIYPRILKEIAEKVEKECPLDIRAMEQGNYSFPNLRQIVAREFANLS